MLRTTSVISRVGTAKVNVPSSLIVPPIVVPRAETWPEVTASVVSESVTFEHRLAAAARLQGDDRLSATVAALAVYERGEYLPGARGYWADVRQQRLADTSLRPTRPLE